MIPIADLLNPLVWGLAVLGAVAALFASSRPGRETRLTA
ncbi:MAG: YtxH domain-containing protein, partial [Armatimonadetes bacterium]|nr:YtxH domain-containing protein [Armatimonadota bacterium]